MRLSETTPGIWNGKLEVTEPGLHRLSDQLLDAVAAAGSAGAREASDILATDKILNPIARATGGSTSWLADGMPRLVKVAEGRQMAGNLRKG